MKIKDTERLLASHARLADSLLACSLLLAKTETGAPIETVMAIKEARELRAEIGRPLT